MQQREPDLLAGISTARKQQIGAAAAQSERIGEKRAPTLPLSWRASRRDRDHVARGDDRRECCAAPGAAVSGECTLWPRHGREASSPTERREQGGSPSAAAATAAAARRQRAMDIEAAAGEASGEASAWAREERANTKAAVPDQRRRARDARRGLQRSDAMEREPPPEVPAVAARRQARGRGGGSARLVERAAAGARSGTAAARARRGRASMSAHALRRPGEARDALWCGDQQQTELVRLSSRRGAAAARRRAAALARCKDGAAGARSGAAAARARRGRASTSAHALGWPGEARDALWHHHQRRTEPSRLSSGGGAAAARRRAAALEKCKNGAAGLQSGAVAARARRGRASTSAQALGWPGEARGARWHRQQCEQSRRSRRVPAAGSGEGGEMQQRRLRDERVWGVAETLPGAGYGRVHVR